MGEIDWQRSAIEANKDSWKDEFWTITFVLIFAFSFISALKDTMVEEFANLKTTSV